MIEIKNLKVEVDGRIVLDGINLIINAGEVHAIMGPNGSGKSTLAKVIAGHPDYKIVEGSVKYLINGRYVNVTTLEPEQRARAGIFLGFQYPVEVPGVSNAAFLREAYNQICKQQLDPYDFEELLRKKLKSLSMDENLINRSVNQGFSGGEKKKNEILQMAVLNPKLALLDETDSGLDIDALKTVANGINKLRTKKNAIVLITHYQRILEYIKPDLVHVMANGRIVKTGKKELALELEKKGYEWLK